MTKKNYVCRIGGSELFDIYTVVCIFRFARDIQDFCSASLDLDTITNTYQGYILTNTNHDRQKTEFMYFNPQYLRTLCKKFSHTFEFSLNWFTPQN